jgi:hypothetical protein
MSLSKEEPSPFDDLPDKASPIANKEDKDSRVGQEDPADSEDEAQYPPADKNGATAANNSKRARKMKHLTREENAEKKKQMACRIQGMKLCDVALTREGDDIETLEPMK